MSSEDGDVRSCSTTVEIPPAPLAFFRLGVLSRKDSGYMTKTIDVITEIIRNPKHPFRKADDRPVKAQKHRYERRKIREFIRLGDWAHENPS